MDSKSHRLLDIWDIWDEYHERAVGATSARTRTTAPAAGHARETSDCAWRKPRKQWHRPAVPPSSVMRAGTAAGHAGSLGKRRIPAT